MTSCVDPKVVRIAHVPGWCEQGVVEGVDVLGLGEEVVRAVCRGAEGRVDADVAAHAARVVPGAVGDWVSGHVVHDGGAGTDVGCVPVGRKLVRYLKWQWIDVEEGTNSVKGPSTTHPPPPPGLIVPVPVRRPVYLGSGKPLPPILVALPLKRAEFFGSLV